ncbi:MAG: coproporphyrinogen III oxidase, partial [Gammaproteobacteria bacterium]|nr:coproporphyrinogen III oxidase [Gammaproteobacteria bacterium]
MTDSVELESIDAERVESYLRVLQNNICQTLESLSESDRFFEDQWEYSGGGGGASRVLESGEVFEKAGVNFSSIHGVKLPKAATAKRTDLEDKPFSAMGVSLVLHPMNPYVP